MWVLLLFEWRIMKYTYSAQPKTLLHIDRKFFKDFIPQIVEFYNADGEIQI